MGFRQKVLKNLVDQGYNVLTSDVDSIWLSYKNVDDLIESLRKLNQNVNVDIINSDSGTSWPKTAFKSFGFTVSGGFLGYKSTENTKNFLKKLAEVCDLKKCDDQAEINNLYLEMGMKFDENGVGKSVKKAGRGVVEELNVFVLDEKLVKRGKIDSDVCDADNHPWVISPHKNVGNFIESHHVDTKLSFLNEFSNCFKSDVKNIHISSV